LEAYLAAKKPLDSFPVRALPCSPITESLTSIAHGVCRVNIHDALDDPHLFAPRLKERATWGAWIAFLAKSVYLSRNSS
jgi:hypothetical protein